MSLLRTFRSSSITRDAPKYVSRRQHMIALGGSHMLYFQVFEVRLSLGGEFAVMFS